MTSLIFVHGTGVRQPAYERTFQKVRDGVHSQRKDINVVPCYWGDDCGVQLRAGGLSIPTYAATDRGDGLSDKEFNLALWQRLYADPLFELRLLAMRRAGGSVISGEESAGQELLNRAKTFPISDALQALLAQADLTAVFTEARESVCHASEFRNALVSAQEPLTDHREAIARAIVATSLLLWQEQNDYLPPVDGELRDKLVEAIAGQLGTGERSLLNWVKQQASTVVMRTATGYLRNHRGKVTDWASPFSGDILLYQARGEMIRAFIERTILSTPGPVVLVGHSLGGIACVELLASRPIPTVQLLVTAGSQAPFLYELDTLRLLPYEENRKLANFPHWLNLWDRADFLSYVAGGLFRSDNPIQDVEVDNNQPFMESHSAYWTNKKVFELIAQRIP